MTELYASTHVLYRMFDRQKKLLYVGITAHPPLRFRSHSETKQWWSRVVDIKLETFETRAELLDAERVAIINERPEYNVVHSTQPRRDESVQGVRVTTYSLDELVDAGLAPSANWLQRRLRTGVVKGRKVGRHGTSGGVRMTAPKVRTVDQHAGQVTLPTALQAFDEMCQDYDLLAAALEYERERGDRLQARLDELEST